MNEQLLQLAYLQQHTLFNIIQEQDKIRQMLLREYVLQPPQLMDEVALEAGEGNYDYPEEQPLGEEDQPQVEEVEPAIAVRSSVLIFLRDNDVFVQNATPVLDEIRRMGQRATPPVPPVIAQEPAPPTPPPPPAAKVEDPLEYFFPPDAPFTGERKPVVGELRRAAPPVPERTSFMQAANAWPWIPDPRHGLEILEALST
jgi:hypothetical protein